MKRVIIESPFAGANSKQKTRFKSYLRKAMLNSMARGEAPFASHGFYTRFLDDEEDTQRAKGINMGLAWMAAAEMVAVYADHGITEGMHRGMARAASLKIPVDVRYLFRKTR